MRKSCDETRTVIADDYKKRSYRRFDKSSLLLLFRLLGMLQQTEQFGRAKVRQEEERKIRKSFKEISKEENAILPDDGMVRKGILTVSSACSTDQLVKVCEHMFQKLSLLFSKAQQIHVLAWLLFSHPTVNMATSVKSKRECRFSKACCRGQLSYSF